MNWGELGEALALVLMLEGLLLLLLPQTWKRMVLSVLKESNNNLRIYGFTVVIAGSFLLSAIRD